MAEVPTLCRICESACGLLAEVRDGAVSLRPDPDHPVSRGYACVKGTRFGELHASSARLRRPRLREPGGLRDASWEEALGTVGASLRSILDRFGPSAVGLYSGNAAGHSLGAVLGVTALQRALGTPRHYACLTLDNSEMFVVADACFGNPMRTAVADYAGSDCVLLVGTDPLSSQPSQAQSHPRGTAELLEAARDGRLLVVDPRRSATAKKAALHLKPRPGTDLWLLGFLARDALEAGAAEDPLLDPLELPRLREALEPFDREAAAAATGLDPSELDALAGRLRAAERPLVWSGLGVLLGPHGTLGWWLTLVLQALLGGLDRPGGWLFHPGAVDLPRLFARLGVPARDPELRSSRGHPAVLGTLAAATLADDVLGGPPGERGSGGGEREDRLRALIVVGGDPLLALPDGARARDALASLDLLVSIDLFENATGSLAHALLPARSWLARDDVAVHMAQQRRLPHLQRAPAVAPPLGEAREDWDILLDLCRAVGRPAFGSAAADRALRALGVRPSTVARAWVAATPGLTWRGLVGRGAARDVPDHGLLRRRGAGLPGGRARLAVPEFVAALAAVAPDGPDPAGRGLPLRLLSSVRPQGSMNHWIGPVRAPVARLHPDDLARLGLRSGEHVRLERADGRDALHLPTRADPDLRPGVVVLPYGRAGGGVVNRLVSTERLEAFTGQPISNGGLVLARAAPGDPP